MAEEKARLTDRHLVDRAGRRVVTVHFSETEYRLLLAYCAGGVSLEAVVETAAIQRIEWMDALRRRHAKTNEEAREEKAP